MFAFKKKSFAPVELCDAPQRAELSSDDVTHGIVAGTKVVTHSGLRPVEKIVRGNKVLTFDGGMQRVTGVRRKIIWTDLSANDTATCPLHVPVGALGNRDAVTLLPHQSVLIESEAAAQKYGDSFAMMPASALEGFRKITRMTPDARVEVYILEFAVDHAVFANIGALFYCPAAVASAKPPHRLLDAAEAAELINLMTLEDKNDMTFMRAA